MKPRVFIQSEGEVAPEDFEIVEGRLIIFEPLLAHLESRCPQDCKYCNPDF